MCYVTSTELKKNLSLYLKKAELEDVYVTKNKKVIAVISNPNQKAIDRFLKLEGCLKPYDDGAKYEDMIGEEIMKRCGF